MIINIKIETSNILFGVKDINFSIEGTNFSGGISMSSNKEELVGVLTRAYKGFINDIASQTINTQIQCSGDFDFDADPTRNN